MNNPHDLDPSDQAITVTSRTQESRRYEPWRVVLPAEERSAAVARAFVDDAIRSWGLAADDDVRLLTSEAVTNSVVHADTAQVVVTITRTGDLARIVVQDDDSTLPVRRPYDVQRVGGIGVALIESLAEHWGVIEIIEDGKEIWFEVELTGTGDNLGSESV